jgi:hypothetical protein
LRRYGIDISPQLRSIGSRATAGIATVVTVVAVVVLAQHVRDLRHRHEALHRAVDAVGVAARLVDQFVIAQDGTAVVVQHDKQHHSPVRQDRTEQRLFD